jgi:hypothetical protein
LRTIVPELGRIGFQVIAVSTDSPQQVDAHRKKNDFPFPLLSDSKMSGARALGIAFHLDDPTVAQYGDGQGGAEKVGCRHGFQHFDRRLGHESNPWGSTRCQ